MKKGFTLIEALAVVSIIGILATTATYAYISATSRSRDARRKSDLTAISLGFQARHDAQTCSNRADIGRYPGYKLGWSTLELRWKSTEGLKNLSDDCGTFSEYLVTVPTEPTAGMGFNYRFDLSVEDEVVGKHYRLATKLEKIPNEIEQENLARVLNVWNNSFGGVVNSLPSGYNYIVGN